MLGVTSYLICSGQTLEDVSSFEWLSVELEVPKSRTIMKAFLEELFGVLVKKVGIEWMQEIVSR